MTTRTHPTHRLAELRLERLQQLEMTLRRMEDERQAALAAIWICPVDKIDAWEFAANSLGAEIVTLQRTYDAMLSAKEA